MNMKCNIGLVDTYIHTYEINRNERGHYAK
jgi:hypothetical protein